MPVPLVNAAVPLVKVDACTVYIYMKINNLAIDNRMLPVAGFLSGAFNGDGTFQVSELEKLVV
jgi:hypothetical protein